MAHAGRADAGGGELVVEPRGGPAAEVGADRLVQRRQDLEQHEHRADQRQRRGERIAALHGADQHAHGDREQRRQQSAQQSTDHHAIASRRSAFGRTLKNFHSARAFRRSNMRTICLIV